MIVSRIKKSLEASRFQLTYKRFIKRNALVAAESISTHLTRAEKVKLFELASGSCKPIAEIGSYVGASSCFLAAGLGPHGGSLYCVDTWCNDAMTEGNRDTFAEFQRNTKAFADRIKALRGTSVEMAERFETKLGLLFVDGDHSYEGVKADWEAWSTHLCLNAIVVFHDIGWAEGVQRVVAEEVAPFATEEGRLPNLYWARVSLNHECRDE